MCKTKVVFSDLDGTLVHFERHFKAAGGQVENVCGEEAEFVFGTERRKCKLLPTSTMGPGLMSFRTIELIQELRKRGVKFVYVTGARCSTILERLPLMAKVDAVFAETGGRFLTEQSDGSMQLDAEWTSRMVPYCGPVDETTYSKSALDRPGVLWDWARELVKHGYVLDTRSYFFCFRVDLEKQSNKELRASDTFLAFMRERMPEQVRMASNLGKYDFFPSISGKGNAVKHYMELHGFRRDEAVCLFDDDNDLPMAEHVGGCFVLQSTHGSVAEALETNKHWTVSSEVGVLAAEQVLETILCSLD